MRVLWSTKYIRRVEVMRISQPEGKGPSAERLARALDDAADMEAEVRRGSFHVVVRV